MKRLSIEEWKKRDNPFKPRTKQKKSKHSKTNKSVFKSKVKPIRDNGVINAAKDLAKIVSNKQETDSSKIKTVSEFRNYLNS